MATTPNGDVSLIDRLVQHYRAHFDVFERFVENLRVLFGEAPDLKPHVHSMRWRVKDPDHLRHKLIRKMSIATEKGATWNVDEGNLFENVNDLAGFRILHLHTSQ